MKRYINIINFLMLIVFFQSCYKDKGNYDLSEINEISLQRNGSDTIIINQFDSLKIQPIINQTMGKEDADLSFKWSAFNYVAPITGGTDVILSDSRDLNVLCGLGPNTYTVLYTVTDNKTGVSSFKKYYLQVNSAFNEGWLMIGEKSTGKRDIHLLNASGQIVTDIYATANRGMELPEGAHTISVLTTFFGGSQNIFILGENDAVRVFYTNFTKLNSLKDWYFEMPKVSKPQQIMYDQVGSNTMFMNNGMLYSNQVDTRFGVALPGDFDFSEYFLPQQSFEGALVYDQKGKRFYSINRKVINTFASNPTAAFDMNNVGMTPLFGGPAPSNQYNYLMLDEMEDPYVLRVNFAGAISKNKVDLAQNIHGATHMVFSGLYFHAYYAVGNKLYMLDIANNKSNLVYEFPSGEEISALALKQSQSSFVGFPDNNRTLAVGTYDGSQGKVYTFSIDNIGLFVNNTFVNLYDKLDKPITLKYKNRK